MEKLKSNEFTFGEWVLIDKKLPAQIIDYYGNGWYVVDLDGLWERYEVDRISKEQNDF